jgi:ribosomal protein S18 acetylase RimI-like enzyme
VGETAPAVLLPWDSGFFGRRIARAACNRLDPVILRGLEDWCALNGVECLYFLADPDAPGSLALAEDSGFRMTDIRVLLKHVIGRFQDGPPGEHDGEYTLRAIRPGDEAPLLEIAGRIHQTTRFWRDPGFPGDRCSELYRRWLERDISGRADHVVVCESGSNPVGYVTCLLEEDGGRRRGTVSLLGVHEDHRKRGLGSLLLGTAVRWFAERGAGTVDVVTQGTNTASLRVYQQAGFLIDSVMIWFHRWFS